MHEQCAVWGVEGEADLPHWSPLKSASTAAAVALIPQTQPMMLQLLGAHELCLRDHRSCCTFQATPMGVVLPPLPPTPHYTSLLCTQLVFSVFFRGLPPLPDPKWLLISLQFKMQFDIWQMIKEEMLSVCACFLSIFLKKSLHSLAFRLDVQLFVGTLENVAGLEFGGEFVPFRISKGEVNN